MKTDAIEKILTCYKEDVQWWGDILEIKSEEQTTVDAAYVELAALKKENTELKKQREIAENRLGDFLDEYNQTPHHNNKRLAQAILNVLHKYYQDGGCGKAYEGTIKELNQYLAEENTRTVAELESIAVAILGLKDSPGSVPPSMYH